METTTEHFDFTSQGLHLKGVLHLPAIKHPPLVIGSHGLEGSKNSAKQMVLSTMLPKNGIAFYRFDHRGCGKSSGNFITDTSLEKRTTDFIAAIEAIITMGKTSSRIAVFGSSMGGATCINAWASIEKMNVELCGGVICSAPVKSRSIENIPTHATDNRPALPLSFFKENLMFDITDKAKDLHHMMIFHGDADEIVPVSNAHEIYKRAGHPKQMIIHKNGDHQMTSKNDQIQFEIESTAWFSRCFTP